MHYFKTNVVDILGSLLADKANTVQEIDGAKAYLIGQSSINPDIVAFEGEMFRATVSTAIRTDTDKDAVIAELATRLHLSEEALAKIVGKNQSNKMVTTVRCVARKS